MAGGAGSNTGTPAASNPLGPQQGQGTPAFGGQQQPSMPSFATPQQQPQQQPTQNPFQPQQQQRPHTGGQMANPLFDQFAQAGRVNDYYQYMRQLERQKFGSKMFEQPDSSMVAEEYPAQSFGDMQYRPQQQPSNMRTMGQIFGFGGGQQQQYGGSPGFFGGGQQPGLVTDAEDRAQMSRSQTGRQQPMQNPFQQQPQQSLSFDQWKKQPRIQDQQYRTPEQQLQRDQQDYQKYLSGTGGMQSPPPMQNPFQPQQPSFMQDPEYQGYQTQANDLQRQMNEYMQKAPMYQQLQDLQGKMAPFQQRYQQQQMQQMQQMQRPSPFRRGQFQQPAGLQGLMGMLGGRGRTVMPQAQPRMSMDMPQTYRHMEALPQNFMKKGGKV